MNDKELRIMNQISRQDRFRLFNVSLEYETPVLTAMIEKRNVSSPFNIILEVTPRIQKSAIIVYILFENDCSILTL